MHGLRPSHKELNKKLTEAREALTASECIFANPAKTVRELYALNVFESQEVGQLILELLTEITPKNYCGTRPPMKAYEKSIKDLELFAFCWESQKMKKKMYLKFAKRMESTITFHYTRAKRRKKRVSYELFTL